MPEDCPPVSRAERVASVDHCITNKHSVFGVGKNIQDSRSQQANTGFFCLNEGGEIIHGPYDLSPIVPELHKPDLKMVPAMRIVRSNNLPVCLRRNGQLPESLLSCREDVDECVNIPM